ncbi:MAG TPA: SRPBCC domain-containing protein [Candidatus Saccharibacteria bacterium]|nr:SRPBCC domain-containing protein [Candidatus Saccharibacteria bacterium]HRK94546.1 SRPBCC domain-containing protein [Candidatus Saccharibacteria bacterium]
MDKTIVTKKPETNQLVFERTFDATQERVFNAFSNADALAKWWGPRGWQTETKEFNFEPGGRWHYGMKCVDENQGEWFGQTSWGIMQYNTIDQPNGFTYIDYFSDETGAINESMPKTETTMNFETVDGKTRVTGTTTCESREAYDQLVNMGMVEGLSETWDRLEEYVQGS